MDHHRRKFEQMRKKLFLWFFLFIFLTTYNCQGTNNFLTGLFHIKDIEIEGVINSNKEELQTRLEEFKTKNLFFLKQSDFEDSIVNLDFVKSLKIKKIYPQKIKIIVVEDSPIGIYFNDIGEIMYMRIYQRYMVKEQ